MSPKHLHQEFTTDTRLEVILDDQLHFPLYVAEQISGIRWLDTELIPIESDLYRILAIEHINMINEHLPCGSFDELDEFNMNVQKQYLRMAVGVRSLPLSGEQMVLTMGYDVIHSYLPDIKYVNPRPVASAYASGRIFDYVNAGKDLPT